MKTATVAVNGDGGEPSAPEGATVATALATNGAGASPEPEPAPDDAAGDVAAEATAASPDDAGYVPMSEWIEDFDRRP
jgi:hypothetical protein